MKPLALVVLASCGNIQGFGGPVPPLASFQVEVTGQPAGNLHVAMVWGRQWLVEAMCLELPGGPLPIDARDDPAAVTEALMAGCRDPFGFVPARVDTNVAVTPGVPTTIDLFTLPGADVLVGDLTARVGYGSFVLYDDRDGNGRLELARPNRPPEDGPPMMNDLPTTTSDVVLGASFVGMTAPDQRVAYREGAFLQSGFYPRPGCGDPPPAFSTLAASGFTAQEAYAATAAGTLPQEDDLSACQQQAPTAAVVTIAPQPGLAELACSERTADSSVRYREPPADNTFLIGRKFACIHSPSFGPPSDVVELVVTGLLADPAVGVAADACVGLTHYVLKGCTESPTCGSPDWNDSPPGWWPC